MPAESLQLLCTERAELSWAVASSFRKAGELSRVPKKTNLLNKENIQPTELLCLAQLVQESRCPQNMRFWETFWREI